MFVSFVIRYISGVMCHVSFAQFVEFLNVIEGTNNLCVKKNSELCIYFLFGLYPEKEKLVLLLWSLQPS